MSEQQREAWEALVVMLAPVIQAWREAHTNVEEFTCRLESRGGKPENGFTLRVTPAPQERSPANE